MSRHRIHWDTWQDERVQKLNAKVQKIQGLQALLEMWETNPRADHDYVLHLRAKLRSAQNQLDVMKP
jgi:hypothetical protein